MSIVQIKFRNNKYRWRAMDILREFLESSTIHGLGHISTEKVLCGVKSFI